MAKIHYGVKTSRKQGGPKMAKIEHKTGHLQNYRRRRARDDTERRAARAQVFVQMGELSSGRAALEAAEVAPGSEDTLQQLQNPIRRATSTKGTNSSVFIGAHSAQSV